LKEPPFTQFTNPKPDDKRPEVPLKLSARAVGVVMVTVGCANAAPIDGKE
jgi:hypothetical protein